jgi:hypothetical protein
MIFSKVSVPAFRLKSVKNMDLRQPSDQKLNLILNESFKKDFLVSLWSVEREFDPNLYLTLPKSEK